MASPNSIFTELVSTTFRNQRKTLADNVTKHNALYRYLTKKGKVDLLDGGLSIAIPLEYANNGTYQRYSGYDVLNIQASDVMSAAEYAWRQVSVNVAASGLELRINSGENALIKLVKQRVSNAMKSFANGMSLDLYSDGTASNQINGLQAIIADSGLGTVGGIDSSAFSFWQNKVQSAATPLQGGGAVTLSATTIELMMANLYYELTRGTDMPDLIVASNDLFAFFEQSQVSFKRYTDATTADGGFVSLKYKGADVIMDGGSQGGGIPNTHMYFINTDYMGLSVHRDANMTELAQEQSINQDAIVIPVLWQGNLTCSNRSLQGVLKL